MRSTATRLTAAIMLAALLLAAAGRDASRADAVELTPDERSALASATTFSKAFTAAAKIIRPAVVNIKVERRVHVSGFNDPFDFFNDLFGPRFPGVPAPRPGRRDSMEIQRGQGSGVIIDPSGYILTNNHVIGDADAIRVALLDGRELPAELIGADPSSDVAVIKIDADNLTVATMGDSDNIEVGEWVLAVGNPFGLDFTVTSGIISARGRYGMNVLETEDFIQTDASINPGNSGGPLVNLKGEVIGINTFIYAPNASRSQTSGSVGVGFAIPSNMAKSIMQSLISHRQVTNSYLGVETQPLDQDLAEAFGLSSPRGALIQAVTKGSPAEKAGLRRGDVVVRWGKREIADDQQFRNLVTITTPGQAVDVEVIRDGRTVLLNVVLEASTPEMVIEGRGDRFLQSMGMQVIDLTPELRRQLGYDNDAYGVVVTVIEPRSPSHQMGFRQGNLIMSVNGAEVRNTQDLKNAIGTSDRSKNITLVWRNGDYLQKVTVTVN